MGIRHFQAATLGIMTLLLWTAGPVPSMAWAGTPTYTFTGSVQRKGIAPTVALTSGPKSGSPTAFHFYCYSSNTPVTMVVEKGNWADISNTGGSLTSPDGKHDFIGGTGELGVDVFNGPSFKSDDDCENAVRQYARKGVTLTLDSAKQSFQLHQPAPSTNSASSNPTLSQPPTVTESAVDCHWDTTYRHGLLKIKGSTYCVGWTACSNDSEASVCKTTSSGTGCPDPSACANSPENQNEDVITGKDLYAALCINSNTNSQNGSVTHTLKSGCKSPVRPSFDGNNQSTTPSDGSLGAGSVN